MPSLLPKTASTLLLAASLIVPWSAGAAEDRPVELSKSARTEFHRAAVASVPPAPDYAALDPSDPCYFFREQARRKGLAHYATEMVWACEALAARRGAGLPLNDRMLATEAAFEAYRLRYLEALKVSHEAQGNRGYWRFGIDLSDDDKHVIAEDTGILVVLETIRNGF